MEKFGGYKKEVKERIERRARLAFKKNVKGEELFEISGRLREETGMKPYLYGPMDYSKTLRLRFHVGDLDLPERRYTRNREEEEVARTCALVANKKKSRTHSLGECKI